MSWKNRSEFYRLEDRVLFEAGAVIQAAEAEAAESAGAEDATAESGEGGNGGETENDADMNEDLASVLAPAESVKLDYAAGEAAQETEEVPVTVDAAGEGAKYTISTPRELLVINSSVADKDAILAERKPNQNVLILEGGGNALEQINDYLDTQDGKYSAIHFVTHGGKGFFTLSGEIMQADNADTAAWAEIGEHLTDDGDLLFYGCDTAVTAEGQALLNKIAGAAGADVAASTDTTGISGDWDLEFAAGDIETETISVENYKHALATFAVTNADAEGEGSLAWAIIDANATNDADLITVDVSLKGQVIKTTGKIDITKALTIEGNGIIIDGGNTFTEGVSDNVGHQIFYVKADTTIDGVTFQNAYLAKQGGAIQVNSGVLTVTDSVFQYNTANEGGAIFISHPGNNQLHISGTEFIQNTAVTGNGGAIYANFSAQKISMDDVTFSGNTAKSSGGAIYMKSGDIKFSDMTFSGNKAASGGAFWFGNNGNGTLLMTGENTFTDNSATGNGGAIYFCKGKIGGNPETPNVMTISGTNTFSGNSAAIGGAIYVDGGTSQLNTLVVEGNALFEYNTAVNKGGAVYIGGGTTLFTGTTFADNGKEIAGSTETVVTGDGGAVYIDDGLENTFTNVTFDSNAVKANGGAVCVGKGGISNFNDVTFTENRAVNAGTVHGGAVYIGNGTNTFTNAVFRENSVENTTYTADSSLSAASSSVTGGGALFIGNGTNSFKDSIFENNDAGFARGGAVQFDGGTGTFAGITLTGNSAATGGAFSLRGGNLSITDSVFEKNTVLRTTAAVASGGSAIISTNTTTPSVAIERTTFTENTGDVLVFPKAKVVITDSTIAGNTGMALIAGISSTHDPVISVIHTTIAGNTADAVKTNGKSIVNLVNSVVVGDTAGTTKGISGGGEYNIFNSVYSTKATGTVTAEASQEVLTYADVFGTNTLQYMHSTQKVLLPGSLQVTAAEVQYLRDSAGNLAGVKAGDNTYGLLTDYTGTTAEARTQDVRGVTVTAGSIGSVDLSSLYVAWTGSAEEDADGNQYFTTIKDALTATDAGGTIYLTEGGIMVTETITVDKNISIVGQGADKTFIDGDGKYSIMTLASKTTVTIDGITFQNGYSTTDGVGGAITTAAATLTIRNSAFVENSVIAKNGGAIFSSTGKITIDKTDFIRNYAIQEGGAILYNGGGLTITDSRFIGNSTNDGVTNKNNRSTGGAIYANGTTTISGTLFAGNQVKGNGGAILAAALNLSNCIFDGNIAGDQGGAVSAKTLTCTDSTFMNNTGSRGGAVTCGGSSVTFVNTTFTGNTAKNYGGVFYAYGTGNFINCTIVGNSAKYGGFAAQDQHVGIVSNLNVLNSVVLDNAGTTGGSMMYAYDHSKETNTRTVNIVNTVYNGDIAENTAGAIDTKNIDTFSTENADKWTAATLLKPAETTVSGQVICKPISGTVAALNGVYVWHDAAWKNIAYSATADGAKTVFLGAEASATTLLEQDQTGSGYSITRTIGSASTLEIPSLVVTTDSNVIDDLDGEISLVEALAYAQAGVTAADGSSTITFASNVNEITLEYEYTISAASGKEIVIDGGDHVTITSGKNTRLFNIAAAADLTFRNITLKANGNVNGDGGMFLVSGANTSLEFNGVTVDGGGTSAVKNAENGGMILSKVVTNVSVIDSTISNFYVTRNGGFIYLNAAGSTLTAENSIFQSVKTNDWGGVFCLWNTNYTFDNIFVEDAQCGNRGAVLFTNNSTGLILNSTFSNVNANSANYGVINQQGGKVYMVNSTISEVKYDGFRIESGEFYLIDSTVTGIGAQMFNSTGNGAKVYAVNSILLLKEGNSSSFASGTSANVTVIGSILSGSATFNANSYGNYDGTVSSIFGADPVLDPDTHTIVTQSGSVARQTGVQTAWDQTTGKVYYYNTDKGGWYDISTAPGDSNKIAESAVSSHIIKTDQLGNDRFADTDGDGSRKFFTAGAVTADEPAAGELPEFLQKSFVDAHYQDGVWYVDTVGTADSVENINGYDGLLSFREALNYAASGDTVKFSTAVFGEGNSTITLDDTLQHWVIGKNLTIDGKLSDKLNITMTVKEAGVTASRLFYVNTGLDTTLQNLTLYGGDISGKADVNLSDTSKNLNNGGGVIFAASTTLRLNSVLIDGGKAKNGGLICMYDSNHGVAAQLYVTDSTLKNGTATEFGGLIALEPDIYNAGAIVEIVGSVLENGSAGNGGAIAFNHDKDAAGSYTDANKKHSLTVKGSVFVGNHLTDSTGEGAAIAVWAGKNTSTSQPNPNMILLDIGADAEGSKTIFTGNYDAASVVDVNGQVKTTFNGVVFDGNNVTETGAKKGALASLISVADMTDTHAQTVGMNEVFNGLTLTGNHVSGALIESAADAVLLGNSLVAENTAADLATAANEYYLSNTIVENTFTSAAVNGTAVNNIIIGNKGGDTAAGSTLHYNLIGTAGTDDANGNLYGVTLKDVYGTDSNADYTKPAATGYAVTNGILTGYTAGSAGAYAVYTSGDGSTWSSLAGTAGTPGVQLDTDIDGTKRGTWGAAGAYQAGEPITLSNDYRTVTGENLTLDAANLERKAGDVWIRCSVRGWRLSADLTAEGVTLEIVSGASITAENLSYANLTVTNNGTLTVTDTLTLKGITSNGTLSFKTLDAENADLDNAGSKVVITGETINALTYQDLTVSGNAVLAGDVTVNGSFSMKGTRDAILKLDGGKHTLTLSDAAKGTAAKPSADIQFTDLSNVTFGGTGSVYLDSGNVLNNAGNALIVIAVSEVKVNGTSLTYGQKLSDAANTTASITTKRGTKIENLTYSFAEPDTIPAENGKYEIVLAEKSPYFMPEGLTADVSVGKAVLTVKFNESAFTKVYDSTDTYTWNSDAYTLTGLQNGDKDITLKCGSAQFDASTVKAGAVTMKGFALEGTNADKYVLKLEDGTVLNDNSEQTVNGSITEKALTVFIGDQAGELADGSMAYGTGITFTGSDKTAQNDSLAAGDKIASCTVMTDKGFSSGGYYVAGTHTVSASVTVMDGDTDVTNCYTITYDGIKTFDVTQRQVTVSFTEPLTKVYDSTDVYTMTADGSEYKLNNIMDGEILKLTVGNAVYSTALAAQDGTTVKFTGMVLTGDENANYILVDAEGKEMTELSGVAGQISKREVTVTIGSSINLSDGGHVKYGVEFELSGTTGALAGNDTGSCTITTDTGYSASGYYAAGTHAVDAILTIMNGSTDVTNCYTVKYEGIKTFTVDKLNITVTAGNASCEVGDPKPDVSAEITGEPAAAGEVIEAKVTGGSTASAGTYTLTPEVTILSESGEDVAMNYEITIVEGKLTVTEAPEENGGAASEDLSQNVTSMLYTAAGRASGTNAVFFGSSSHLELRDTGLFFSIDCNGTIFDRMRVELSRNGDLYSSEQERLINLNTARNDCSAPADISNTDTLRIGDDVQGLQVIGFDTEKILPETGNTELDKMIPVSGGMILAENMQMMTEHMEYLTVNGSEKSAAGLKICQVESTLSAKAFERTESADPETVGIALAQDHLLLHRASACQDELDELLEAFLAV